MTFGDWNLGRDPFKPEANCIFLTPRVFSMGTADGVLPPQFRDFKKISQTSLRRRIRGSTTLHCFFSSGLTRCDFMFCAEQEGQGARLEQFLDLNVERDEPPRKLSCAILLSLPRNSAALSVTSFSSSISALHLCCGFF